MYTVYYSQHITVYYVYNSIHNICTSICRFTFHFELYWVLAGMELIFPTAASVVLYTAPETITALIPPLFCLSLNNAGTAFRLPTNPPKPVD